jgi:hypothetical protein
MQRRQSGDSKGVSVLDRERSRADSTDDHDLLARDDVVEQM